MSQILDHISKAKVTNPTLEEENKKKQIHKRGVSLANKQPSEALLSNRPSKILN